LATQTDARAKPVHPDSGADKRRLTGQVLLVDGGVSLSLT
jgi:hypothetical protein